MVIELNGEHHGRNTPVQHASDDLICLTGKLRKDTKDHHAIGRLR
jgi:hypothetical protein